MPPFFPLFFVQEGGWLSLSPSEFIDAAGTCGKWWRTCYSYKCIDHRPNCLNYQKGFCCRCCFPSLCYYSQLHYFLSPLPCCCCCCPRLIDHFLALSPSSQRNFLSRCSNLQIQIFDCLHKKLGNYPRKKLSQVF